MRAAEWAGWIVLVGVFAAGLVVGCVVSAAVAS